MIDLHSGKVDDGAQPLSHNAVDHGRGVTAWGDAEKSVDGAISAVAFVLVTHAHRAATPPPAFRTTGALHYID